MPRWSDILDKRHDGRQRQSRVAREEPQSRANAAGALAHDLAVVPCTFDATFSPSNARRFITPHPPLPVSAAQSSWQ
jgi:hypothetical protein